MKPVEIIKELCRLPFKYLEEYDVVTGPKTKGTRLLVPVKNIAIDHENKLIIFERECELWENGD